MKFVLKVAIAAVAVWFATLLPLEVVVSGGTEEWWKRILVFLFVGLVLVSINAIIKPIITVLSIPLLVLTLGLFYLVIAWFSLWLTSWIASKFDFVDVTIGGFWRTLLAALVISITMSVLEGILLKDRKRRR